MRRVGVQFGSSNDYDERYATSQKELCMVGDNIIQRIKYLLKRHNTEVTIFINRKKQTLIENPNIFTLYSMLSYRNNC